VTDPRAALAATEMGTFLADVAIVLDQVSPHYHRIKGIWDDDNGPGKAGTACQECAARARLRSALAAGWTPPTTDDGRPDDPTAMRQAYPENGPLGRVREPVGDVLDELARLHTLASHRLTVMTDLKRQVRDAALAPAPPYGIPRYDPDHSWEAVQRWLRNI
jgi:hypothetical protein